MAASAQYSVTVRVELDARQEPLGKITAQIAEAGGALQSVDLIPGAGPEGKRVREFTIDAASAEAWEQILRSIGSTRGARVLSFTDRTFEMHKKGKIEQHNKYPLKTRDDLSMAYTPGVARVCEYIAEDKTKAFDFTIKANTVAVVSDGSAVLGLGDIGPEAAMPVMEGKAMLFKEFAQVDAFPICLATNDPEEIIQTVKLIAPTFGGINLEDISAPRCFEIEGRLKEELDIPVFHDDQHGTAVVVMAALFNSLKITGKPIEDLRVLVLGTGAAGIACTKMMQESGISEIIGCDRQGAISTDRTDYGDGSMSAIKKWFAENTNHDKLSGGPDDVIEGCDLFIGLSGPGLIQPASLGKMNDDAIVFAMANPTPEVMPEEADEYVRIMATGRSDYPNQINNVLCFPGIFRGALDAGAPRITEEMKLAAARGIAEVVTDDDLAEDYIIPSVFNRDVATSVANAVVEEAKEAGLARFSEETGTYEIVDGDGASGDGAASGDWRRLEGLRRRLRHRTATGRGQEPGRRLHQDPRRPQEAEPADKCRRGRQRRVHQLVRIRHDIARNGRDPEGHGSDQVECRRASDKQDGVENGEFRKQAGDQETDGAESVRRPDQQVGSVGREMVVHPEEGGDIEGQGAGELNGSGPDLFSHSPRDPQLLERRRREEDRADEVDDADGSVGDLRGARQRGDRKAGRADHEQDPDPPGVSLRCPRGDHSRRRGAHGRTWVR